MAAPAEHPAKFSPEVMAVVRERLLEYLPNPDKEGYAILDPFAGVGGVHELRELGYLTYGVEIESEWARQSWHTLIGDATNLDWIDDAEYDGIVTSPCYGNRMADHHNAKDGSDRITYRHKLGRPLSENSAGAMQWGKRYRDLHEKAWREAVRVLKPGGVFVLNISNHYRKGKLQRVTEWHLRTLMDLGLTVEEIRKVKTRRMRRGANGGKRAEFETVAILRKAE